MKYWAWLILLLVLPLAKIHTQSCAGLNAGFSEWTALFPESKMDDRNGVQQGGSEFTIYSEDYDLFGDPDPTTAAGIRFLVFLQQPDLDGWVTLSELEDHPHVVRVDGRPLLAGTGENGLVRINQRAPWEFPFGQRVPVRLWFVPVTVHNVDSQDFDNAFEGACIHMNSVEPISIYFIRHLELDLGENYWDKETNEVTIPASGGLPEIEPDRFQYNLQLLDCKTGEEILLEKRGINLFVFQLDSLFGKYDILVTDGFSPFYLLQCLPITRPTVHFMIPDRDVFQNDEFCLPVRVRDFWNIDSFSISFQWDESVIDFTGFGPPRNIHPELKKGTGLSFHRLSGGKGGRIMWETNGDPAIIPDDDVLFHLCFQAVGRPGSRTPVDTLGKDHRFYWGEWFLGPRVDQGEVRIVRDDYIGFSYEMLSCPETSGPVNVAMNITGKNPPFSLSFDPADTEDRVISGHQDTLYGIPQGTYDITVTDILGQNITKINQEFSTGFRGDFRLTLDSVRSHDPLCNGDANGEINVNVYHSKSMQYSLYYQKGEDPIEVKHPLIRGLSAGEYSIWAVDQRGCEAHLPAPVVLNDLVPLTLIWDHIRMDCGKTDTLVRFENYVDGGTGVVRYALENDTLFHAMSRDTLLEAGMYDLRLRDFLECEATTTFSVDTGASDISFTFDHPGDTLFVYPEESFEVSVDLSRSDIGLQYDWSASGGKLVEFQRNKAQFRFQTEGMIRLKIIDPFGCDYSDQLVVAFLEKEESEEPDDEEENPGEVENKENCIVSIPNAVTPNGDGVNDDLKVFSSCPINVIAIRIFDKWGGELYRVQDKEIGIAFWQDLPPGMVMVQVTYETDEGIVNAVGQAVLVIK